MHQSPPLLSPLECCGNPVEAIQLWEGSQQLLFASSCHLPASVRDISLVGKELHLNPTPLSSAATALCIWGFLSVPSVSWQFSGCCPLSGRAQHLHSSLTQKRSWRAILSSSFRHFCCFPAQNSRVNHCCPWEPPERPELACSVWARGMGRTVGRRPLPAVASHGCDHELRWGEDRYSCKVFFSRVFLRKHGSYSHMALGLCTAPCRDGQGQRVVRRPEYLFFPVAGI